MMKNWIESKGGPFVILDRVNALKWSGLDGDYDIACGVDGYSAIIHMSGYDAIALGDEAMPLRLIKKGSNIIIFRWMYAPSNEIADDILNEMDIDKLLVTESFSIRWDSTDLVLFDSADVFEATKPLFFSVANKNCVVKTMQYTNNETSFIIHCISDDNLSD